MRKPFVAGNWKMNGTAASGIALVRDLQQALGGACAAEVVVFPPSLQIPGLGALCSTGCVLLGAQDVSDQASGAYTGELSVAMLSEFSCTHVIVGHSERRARWLESDAMVAQKALAALAAGLTPVVCVGETLLERQSESTLEVVGRQLEALLETVSLSDLPRCVLAYEPVWAIGTGLTATPEQAQAVHAFIRGQVAQRDQAVAESIRIVYGGSVKADNATALFAQPDIDGGLVGGASLVAKDFESIVKASYQRV